MGDEELQRLRRQAAEDPTLENLAKLGLVYLRHSSQKHTIQINGKRHVRAGNTYHTATVYLDGELLGRSGVHYGYGDQYVETGMAIVEAQTNLPHRQDLSNGGKEQLYSWCERNNIEVKYSAIDVRRRRDLLG